MPSRCGRPTSRRSCRRWPRTPPMPGHDVAYEGPARAVLPLRRLAAKRALSNLVDNALTHGRPPVRLRIRDEGPRVVVEVADAGAGIGRRTAPGRWRPSGSSTRRRAGARASGLRSRSASRRRAAARWNWTGRSRAACWCGWRCRVREPDRHFGDTPAARPTASRINQTERNRHACQPSRRPPPHAACTGRGEHAGHHGDHHAPPAPYAGFQAREAAGLSPEEATILAPDAAWAWRCRPS